MTEDRWITPQEARTALMEIPGVVRVKRVLWTSAVSGERLAGVNKHGCALMSVRIFDGTEHELARENMVLDWRT